MYEVHKSEKHYLYNDGTIKIEENPQDWEGHIVTIGKESYIFPSRVLSDLYGRENDETLMQGLNAMNPFIKEGMKIANVSPERLGWALAKARVKELEDTNHNLRSQIFSLEDRVRY